MVVKARCYDCKDEHQVGDRKLTEEKLSTQCPACGSTSYDSYSESGAINKSEAERIRDAIKDIPGVGETVIDNIVASFSTLAELEAASAERLAKIPRVGKTVAKRITQEL